MSLSNETVIAEKLLQIQAVKLNVEQPFTWTSGWKSPIYCDNRKILSFPYVREFVKSEMCNLLFESYPDVDMLAGVATAGISWGALAADQLKLPFIYVRAKAKEHGLGNQIEGYYEKGKSVVVIEDLISTGKSSMEAVKALKEAGLHVVAIVSIFTYGYYIAAEVIAAEGIEYKSLTNYNALVQLAVEKNIIPADALTSLEEWRQNPSQWRR